MKDIIVKNCNNCPFKVTSYDSDSIGLDTFEECNLIKFLNPTYVDNYISSYNSYDEPDVDECDYCKSYLNEYHENHNNKQPEPEFDETKCECEKLRQEYIDSQPVIEFKNPEWCPLTEINIKLEK